ncbi:hypothetical protein CRV00_02610 [Malaciobacter molluscorum]|uniref:cupin domain-containing protein n=1 Tax=Malaciobacter molluscorum TaxID=1032072 RepID=UPI00100A3B35|nr:cupin domain-containing protein [Malaciobacter molluscorum]RXJ96093.1 hypothetical protein CRV00_02610 [Malaciobacter molluscorum]
MQDIINIEQALKNAVYDEKVGIKISSLIEGETFNLYALQIKSKNKIGAHYHQKGNETYQILKGEGIMMLAEEQNGKITWQQPRYIKQGECINVKARQVHQLINTSDEDLICIAGCSHTHNSTDRFIVEDYVDN